MTEYFDFIEALTDKGYKHYKFDLQNTKSLIRQFYKLNPEMFAKKVLLIKRKFYTVLTDCLEVKICPVCGKDIVSRSFEHEDCLGEVIVENIVFYCTSCKSILDTTEKVHN